MSAYVYAPLDDSKYEIRILTLLPGTFDDPLEITIEHAPLKEPEISHSQRLSRKELQATLPPEWTVWENLEGRYFFLHFGDLPNRPLHPQADNSQYAYTTWTHPDANFDHSRFEVHHELPGPTFQPQYEALSYVWGSEMSPGVVYIHESQSAYVRSCGTTLSSTLSIGANLEEALRHLRLASRPRRLWIDAICINQEDLDERSKQVRRMENIFSLAQRVVVWLGPQRENSQLALATLQHLSEQVEWTRDGKILMSPACSEPRWYRGDVALPYDETTWQAINSLIGRSWFKRIWTFQEIHLANSQAIVQCGLETIPWPPFRRAAFTLHAKLVLPFEQLRQSLGSIEGFFYRNKGFVLTLLDDGRRRRCKDPRDKIYGVLSLTPLKFAQQIPVDYTLRTAVLYKEVALTLLKELADLSLLTHCTLETALAEAPTWVPNWSMSPTTSGSRELGWRASGHSSACTLYVPPNKLELLGLECDVVRTVRLLRGNQHEVQKIIKDVQPANVLSDSETYVAGGRLLEAFVGLIAFGQYKERYPRAGGRYETLDRWKEVTRQWLLTDSPDVERSMATLLEDNLEVMEGHTILSSESGYLGLGPSEAQPGDHICVALGCNTPIVLRKEPSGNFQVVGDCYVHGLMEGEVVLGALPDPWVVQYMTLEDAPLYVPTFVNARDGISQSEDPRLADVVVPPEWEDLTAESPEVERPKFKHRDTGKILKGDPRLLPQHLEARGIELQKFTLI